VNHADIDESCLQQGCNEVAVLLPERAELGNTDWPAASRNVTETAFRGQESAADAGSLSSRASFL
jgi:hypothetical protein